MSLRTLIDATHPDSPQLLTVVIAAVAFPLAALIIVCSVAKVIAFGGTLRWPAVIVFIVAMGSLAAACGLAMKFKDIIPAGLIPTGVAPQTANLNGGAGGADRGTSSVEALQ